MSRSASRILSFSLAAFSEVYIMQSWSSDGQPHSGLMLPSLFLFVAKDATVCFSKSKGILKLWGRNVLFWS